MNWSVIDTHIVLTGMACAMACAVPGNFLVLRKMSLMGDAISHALLPGIVAAFIFTGSRASWPIFLGAAAAGVLTAWLAELLRGRAKVDEGASMGIVFTTLFAIGLILLRKFADGVDLDADCVLNGMLETSMLNTVTYFGITMPDILPTLTGVFLVNITVVILLYKELKISSFDPQLATTMGINARAMHYLLMSLTAITTVAAFEAVGPILVIAMLVVPAASAYLLTNKLPWMIALSLLIAALSAPLGHISALTMPRIFGVNAATTSSGMMATAAGLLFVLILFLSPAHGVFAKLRRQSQLRQRIVREDILAMLYRAGEQNIALSPADLARRCDLNLTTVDKNLKRLKTQKLIQTDAATDTIKLTSAGENVARAVVRSHRLWEQYLGEQSDIPVTHLHTAAERLEHVTDAGTRQRLSRHVSSDKDPHGKNIPAE
jgi:manganese/zinc/iron transport system permease protein